MLIRKLSSNSFSVEIQVEKAGNGYDIRKYDEIGRGAYENTIKKQRGYYQKPHVPEGKIRQMKKYKMESLVFL